MKATTRVAKWIVVVIALMIVVGVSVESAELWEPVLSARSINVPGTFTEIQAVPNPTIESVIAERCGPSGWFWDCMSAPRLRREDQERRIIAVMQEWKQARPDEFNQAMNARGLRLVD